MARLWHSGAELGHEHAEGVTLSGTTMTLDTGTKRTGTRSFKFDTSATCYLFRSFGGATGTTYYGCGHFLIPAASGLPGSDANILQFTTGAGGLLVTAQLRTTGKMRLLAPTSTVVGSESSATVTTDTWYRVEIVVNINAGAGADDTAELYLDGVAVAASSALTIGTTAPDLLRFGFTNDPGTSEVIFWDDLAINSNAGSVNTTLVGNTEVYALHPTADSARVNWTDGAGGTTNLFDSVDNIPPTGVATASSGATNQIENPTSGSAAYDATMTTYTAAGITSADLITALYTVIEAGSSSTTGSDTITHELVSNPAVAANGTNSVDIVAGTYPASWNRGAGTITENPSPTLGTAPVLRVTKTAAVTRIHTVCLMAISVAILPDGAPTGTRYRSIMMVG
jgi:hypothetical protein